MADVRGRSGVSVSARGDSSQFQVVLGCIRVPRLGPGGPRVRPAGVRADNAYAFRKNRAYLRRCSIRCTIPDEADHPQPHETRLPWRPPPKSDPADYKARHAGECGMNRSIDAVPWRRAVTSSRPLRGDRPRSGQQRMAV
ncbi:LOW QUALITY PROTEIN: conserved hypothetical protein, partial [Streptomyces sviceus ATCC 29083]